MESDFKKYYKSKEVSDDIIKLLSDETYDAKALKEYIENNQYAHELVQNFSDEKELAENIARFNQFDVQRASDKMVKIIQKKRVVKLTWILSTSVAAIMVLSFFIFNFSGDEKLVAQNETTDQTAPILILNSGEKINLSKVTSEIVTDGYVIKTENNTISTDVKLPSKNLNNTLIIPKQCSYTVKLADGSSVKLNAGGRLSYPVAFDGSQRIVCLEEGEAFFTVSKSDKPFIVKTGSGEVKVYGTKFNVKNFKNGDVETVLVEGSVGVSNENSKEVKIKPNQRIIFSDHKYVIEDIKVDDYVAWTNDNFMYNGVSLQKVVEDIENWYGVKINTEGFNCNVDLYVSRDATIGKVLKLMEIATNKKFINDGGENYSVK